MREKAIPRTFGQSLFKLPDGRFPMDYHACLRAELGVIGCIFSPYYPSRVMHGDRRPYHNPAFHNLSIFALFGNHCYIPR